MLQGLEYVKETIELRKQDIENNDLETNSLLMDDVLLAFGYNKRRDKGVKAVYAGGADWEISEGSEVRMLIKVYGYNGEEPSGQQLSEVMSLASELDARFVILTDGNRLSVYAEGSKILGIDTLFSDENDDKLQYLTNSGWDPDRLIVECTSVNITEKVSEYISSEAFIQSIINGLSLEDTDDTRANIRGIISNMGTVQPDNGDSTELQEQSGLTESSELAESSELLELKAKISSQTTELEEVRAELADTKAKLLDTEAQLESANAASNQGDAEKIADLNAEIEDLNAELQRVNNIVKESDNEIKRLQELQKSNAGENGNYTEQTIVDSQELDRVWQELTQKTQELETARQSNDELKQHIAELNSEIEQLQTGSADSDSIKAELEALKNESVELNNTISSLNDEISKLNTELSDAIESRDSAIQDNDDIKKKLDDALQNNSKLQAEIEGLKVNGGVGQSDTSELQQRIDEQASEISKLEQELHRAKEQLAANAAVTASTGKSGFSASEEEAYRRRVSDLLSQVQELQQELQNTNDELEKLRKEKEGAEDERVVMARQLLEAVEDNPDLNRTYIGVVNSKLFQIGDLPRFIGTCLQELYAAVSFKLMPLLFDGDIFKTVQPAVRGDMMINTKRYDIDIDGYTEEELINKLKVLFAQFEDVVFMCKAIGTLREQPKEIEQQYREIDEPQFDSIPDFDTDSEQSGGIGQATQSGEFMGGNSDGEGFEASDNSGFDVDNTLPEQGQFDNSEIGMEEPQVIQNETVLALALCDVGQILWSDNSPIHGLVAMANSYRIVKINDNDISNTLGDSISALIGLSGNPLESLDKVRNTDLVSLTGIVKPVSECGDSYIRILDTDYAIENATNQQIISFIITLAQQIGVGATDIYMYFLADYIPGSTLEQNYVNYNDLGLGKTIENADIPLVNDTIHCLISGKDIENIQNIQGVEEIEQRLFNKVVAVGVSGFSTAIKNQTEFVDALQRIIESSESKGAEQIIEAINSRVHSKNPIIARDIKNVSVEAATLVVGNREYFIDEMSALTAAQVLMYANIEATGGNLIDIRIDLNSSLYTALKDSPITTDPYEFAGSQLIIATIASKTKTITRK